MTIPHVERVRVAVVGGGPAGIGAALGLARQEIGPVVLIDRWDRPGGVPAKYRVEKNGVPTYVAYTRGKIVTGEEFVEGLLRPLSKSGVQLALETSVIDLNAQRRALTVVNPQHGKHVIEADAIVLATGAREQTGPERGWIAGSRQLPHLQTMQLLELLARKKQLTWRHAVVAGSDLVAFAAAAKLKAAGVERVEMLDTSLSPQTPLLARRYFRNWVQPHWKRHTSVRLRRRSDSHVQLESPDGSLLPCDALVFCGELVPNSELLVAAAISTKPPFHVPVAGSRGRLSTSGCFAVGNLLGGFHGGQWCYFNGRRVAKAVAAYLRSAAGRA